MDDLKPCPFCGGKARYRTGCGVECSECFANIVEARRLRDSVCAGWNRRSATALSEAHATIARLKALLQEAVDSLDDGWGTEQVTKEAAEAYFELMPRLKAALSPREGEG